MVDKECQLLVFFVWHNERWAFVGSGNFISLGENDQVYLGREHALLICIPMMKISNGNIFRVSGPLTKANDAELWCFLLAVPEQTLRKQSWRRWIETPSHTLWRHCHVIEASVACTGSNVHSMISTTVAAYQFFRIIIWLPQASERALSPD